MASRHHDHAHETHDHPHRPGPGTIGSHDHFFLGTDHSRNESRLWIVIALTSATMVAEIAAGSLFGSMALLADGFHMATHAGALLIAALASLFARRHANDDRFSFGTGKFGDLAAFASAVILAVIAIGIGFESVLRLASPVPIQFSQAIVVAVIGLVVNLVSAVLLHQGDHGHEHAGHSHGGHEHGGHEHGGHGHGGHEHGHAHGDRNMRAAYLHVLADALTSVLAIGGLLAGWFYGWIQLDAIVGILAAVVIVRWSIGLLKDSGAVLLDVVPSRSTETAIRRAIETGGDRIADLHLWRVGPGHMAAVICVVSSAPRPAEIYRAKLSPIAGLSHVNVEVLQAA